MKCSLEDVLLSVYKSHFFSKRSYQISFCLKFSVTYVSFHVLTDLSKPNQYLIFGLILWKYFQTLSPRYIHLLKNARISYTASIKLMGLK